MVLGRLRHAEQAIDFGEQAGQRAAIAQHPEHARGLRFHQAACDLLPHPLGHQRVDLAVVDHPPHQRIGFRRHRKVGETGGEARNSQNADRILGEGFADVAEHSCRQIALPAIGVHQRAGLVLGHRVDGEVAPPQVFLQRDVRRGVHGEPL